MTATLVLLPEVVEKALEAWPRGMERRDNILKGVAVRFSEVRFELE